MLIKLRIKFYQVECDAFANCQQNCLTFSQSAAPESHRQVGPGVAMVLAPLEINRVDIVRCWRHI